MTAMEGNAAPLTDLIRRAQDGDEEALRQVFDSTYEDLRRMARGRINQGGRGTLLDTTSLVSQLVAGHIDTHAAEALR